MCIPCLPTVLIQHAARVAFDCGWSRLPTPRTLGPRTLGPMAGLASGSAPSTINPDAHDGTSGGKLGAGEERERTVIVEGFEVRFLPRAV